MNELHPALYTDVSKRLAHFFDRHAHFAQKCDGSQDIVDAEKAGHTDLCVPRGVEFALAVELYAEKTRAAQRIYILRIVIAFFVEAVAYHLAL